MRKETKKLIKTLQKRRSRGFEIKVILFLEEECYNWLYEPDKFHYVKLKCKECKTIVKEGFYTPDFKIESRNNTDIYIETKGKFTAADRKKHLAIKESHPDLDIRFMFEKPNNKIRKGAKQTCGEWATKNGFKWCGPVFPKEWLDEMVYR